MNNQINEIFKRDRSRKGIQVASRIASRRTQVVEDTNVSLQPTTPAISSSQTVSSYKKLQTHPHNNTGSEKNGDESQFSQVSRLIADTEALAVSISALCPTDSSRRINK
jgi:hypothetical protein